MAYQQIIYQVVDHVLTITLNRPDRMNAFTRVMMDELIDAFDRADADDEVRAIVVTGAGRAFCAGADLEKGGSTFDYRTADTGESTALDALRDGGGRVTLRIFRSIKPVFAAINGSAVGVGITMTLPMDIRIVADHAKLGFVFTRRGITPEACSTWFLPRIVGISQASEWILTGRLFGAAEALERGLVTRLAPSAEVYPAALELARELAQNTSAVSCALARQMLWTMLGARDPMQAHRLESRAIVFMGKTPDAAEGVGSFLQKRAPNFAMKPSTDLPDFFPWRAEPPFDADATRP